MSDWLLDVTADGSDDLLAAIPGDLRSMVMAYLEAALWSSTDNTADNGGDPLDKHYGIEHIDKESIQKAVNDCRSFREKAGDLLDGTDDTQVGHDFWLTRNGHGTGFWDRGSIYGEERAKQLSEIAKSFGSSDATLSWGKDDAVIQLSHLFR